MLSMLVPMESHYMIFSERELTFTFVRYIRDVNETLAYETETFGFRSETRPRPCKAETETFFKTFNLPAVWPQ